MDINATDRRKAKSCNAQPRINTPINNTKRITGSPSCVKKVNDDQQEALQPDTQCAISNPINSKLAVLPEKTPHYPINSRQAHPAVCFEPNENDNLTCFDVVSYAFDILEQ